MVVDIFNQIREQMPAKLLLVGDGPDLPAACRRAREYGLSDDVLPLGEQEQVVPLLSIADVCLLPSKHESFGVAALEAMACEVPVVASRVGGLPEVVTDGETGFLHEPDDVQGMVTSATKLLTDEAFYQRISMQSCKAVQQRFCANEIVPRYEAFYETVLSRSRMPSGSDVSAVHG